MTDTKLAGTTPPPSGHQTRGFYEAGGLLAGMILSALVAQHLAQIFSGSWLGIAGPALVLAAYVAVFFQALRRTIATPYFATLTLLLIALGTAAGTFVTQNTPPDVFTQRYGDTGSALLRGLHLDDVFHSWWYVGFYALLGASLLKSSWQRKFSRANLGFHLAHLGPVIVLTGFWIDYFQGFRGIIQLEIGEQTNIAKVFKGNTGYVKDSVALDFAIRLDHFEFEKHDPDYRIQLWRNPSKDLHAHAEPISDESAKAHDHRPEIVASLPLKAGKVHRIYGTEVRLRLREFYPNFIFEYKYPDLVEDVAPTDPGALIDLVTPLGNSTLQLLSNRPGRNVLADVNHLGAWLEFYWEAPAELVEALEGDIDPKWAEVNRVLLIGKERRMYTLVDGVLSDQALETEHFYTFPNRKESGFSVQYIYPDAGRLQASPATEGNELLNPVAKVEVWEPDWSNTEEAYLYPGGGSRGGTYLIPDTDYFLALESLKDRETKYYKSELSAVDLDNGSVLKEETVVVNEPMFFGGYRFYQTDYDPNNPKYSGIGISYEPGLYAIYFGFAVLATGCFLLFYQRPGH